MKDSVMVTGAAGFIGGQTMLALHGTGKKIIGVDTRPLPSHLKSIPDICVQEDFSNQHCLDLVNQYQPQAIIHCAGTSLVGPSVTNPELYFRNNFVKTKTLVDFLIKNRIKSRLIFSSSASVYGDPPTVPCSEDSATEPVSPYGQSKLMIELLLKSYANAYGLDWVAFRYFNACGADPLARHGQEPRASHIIARVLECTKNDQTFTLFGNSYPTTDGTCVRDYVHVADIARAHVQAIDRTIPCSIYNLGGNQPASNLQIIAMAEEITKKKLKLHTDAMRPGDPAILTASAALFQNTAGWIPEYRLEDMISHAWTWYNRCG